MTEIKVGDKVRAVSVPGQSGHVGKQATVLRLLSQSWPDAGVPDTNANVIFDGGEEVFYATVVPLETTETPQVGDNVSVTITYTGLVTDILKDYDGAPILKFDTGTEVPIGWSDDSELKVVINERARRVLPTEPGSMVYVLVGKHNYAHVLSNNGLWYGQNDSTYPPETMQTLNWKE